jgi:hypothetical protein
MFYSFNKYLIDEIARLRDRITFLETRQAELVDTIAFQRRPERLVTTPAEAKNPNGTSPKPISNRPSDAYSAAQKRAEAKIDEMKAEGTAR